MTQLDLISKEEALKLNQKWYYTGIPCQNNHIDKRYVNTGICYACKRELNKACNKRNPEQQKIREKSNYKRNKVKIAASGKAWTIKNRSKSNQYKSNWKKVHREQHLAQAREYARNQRKDPYKRVSKNMSKAIWNCLKHNKNHCTWLKFVDFTLGELIQHLEQKFTPEMSWQNYGVYWHIDHIKPISWFDLHTEFKDAWALSNLQPLEASENLSKNNRYIG